MKPTKHIFIQVNTDALIEIHKAKELVSENSRITHKEALDNCLIFSQGSMSMGDPIKNFIVETDVEQEISFTILPLSLFTTHLLYFKNFHCSGTYQMQTFPKLGGSYKPVSFIIDSTSLKEPGEIPFTLDLVLEYRNFEGEYKSLELCIDPVLQVKQS